MNNLIGSNTAISSPACAICQGTEDDQGRHSMVRTLCHPKPHLRTLLSYGPDTKANLQTIYDQTTAVMRTARESKVAALQALLERGQSFS